MINPLSKIPSGARTILLVMGTLGPVMMMAGNSIPVLRDIWIPAYIALGAIAGLAGLIQYNGGKKKAKKFTEGVQAEGRKDFVGPVQGEQEFANLDHLKREFQRGIDIYKNYGKSLYSLPWYVVVGEPGAGKTEAVRNSEIKFPPKLQNLRQGVGGTQSMHWWFTDYAVILDTAGSLFFDSNDEDRGKSGWNGFLRMLKKHRPDCPINGLLLVIPATSLSADTPGEIERKAGVIARQLENIQTELKIRFPVYTIITKTDRLTGFREYFDPIKETSDRYQMFGWSNPDRIEMPFQPKKIKGYLADIVDRLSKRRRTYLKDPVPRDPVKKRADEVDDLYAFPNSIEGLASNLTRYLEVVFGKDGWQIKPPYLRGIYFTSALQRGSVLDAKLVEALGLNLRDEIASSRDLPDNATSGGFRRDHSFFLRDLFINKIFVERGLVTAQSSKSSGPRSPWVTAGIVGLALMGVLLLLALISGKQARAEQELWSLIAGSSSSSLTNRGKYVIPVISDIEKRGQWEYLGGTDPNGMAVGFGSRSRLGTLESLETVVSRGPDLGWIFLPARIPSGLDAKRSEVFRTVVNQSVIQPLIDASLLKIESDSEAVDLDERNAAVLALVKYYAGSELSKRREEAVTAEEVESSFVAPLIRFAVSDQYIPEDDISQIAGILARTYPGRSGDLQWPPAKQIKGTDLLAAVRKTLEVHEEVAGTRAEREAAFKDALSRFDRLLEDDSDDAVEQRFTLLKAAYDQLESDPSIALLLRPETGGAEAKADPEASQKSRNSARDSVDEFLSEFVRNSGIEPKSDPVLTALNEILARSKRSLNEKLFGLNARDAAGGDALLEKYLPSDRENRHRYRTLYETVYNCRFPMGEAGLGSIRSEKEARERVEGILKLQEEVRAGEKYGYHKFCERLLNQWISGQMREFAATRLQFPFVIDRNPYVEIEEHRIAATLLELFEEVPVFADVVRVKKSLFDERGEIQNWKVRLGNSTEDQTFVSRIEVSSKREGDQWKIHRGDKEQEIAIRVDSDILIKVFDYEGEFVKSYDHYGRLWGMLLLVLKDPDIEKRELLGATTDTLQIRLREAPDKNTLDSKNFWLRFQNGDGTRLISPEDWPRAEEILRQIPATEDN